MKKGISKADLLKAIIAVVVSLALILGLKAFESKSAEPSAKPAGTGTTDAAEGTYTPGSYTGSAHGFGGDVIADITIGENGAIEAVTLTGDSETPEIGGAALEELQTQVLTAQSADIDGVSGASLTSGAVKEAVAAALAQAGGEPVADAHETVDGAEGEYTPGTYSAIGRGYCGDVTVEITVGENGGIEKAVLTGYDETPEVGGAALTEMEGQILTAQSAEIDGVSGATYTSDAVKEALADAIAQAGGK